jgi:hypothetical protein
MVTDAVGGSAKGQYTIDSSTSSCTTFSYSIDLNSSPGTGCCGNGVSFRTWTFQAIAPATGTLTFQWHYSGFHAFFAVNALFQVFSGANIVTLYNPPQQNCCNSPSAGFDITGTYSIQVTAGQAFGFTVGGSNGDSNSFLGGELSIGNAVIQ